MSLLSIMLGGDPRALDPQLFRVSLPKKQTKLVQRSNAAAKLSWMGARWGGHKKVKSHHMVMDIAAAVHSQLVALTIFGRRS